MHSKSAHLQGEIELKMKCVMVGDFKKKQRLSIRLQPSPSLSPNLPASYTRLRTQTPRPPFSLLVYLLLECSMSIRNTLPGVTLSMSTPGFLINMVVRDDSCSSVGGAGRELMIEGLVVHMFEASLGRALHGSRHRLVYE